MNVVLWIAQGLLAAVYLLAGGMKALRPIAELRERMTWVRVASPRLVRFVAIAEVLGAIGLILPWLTGILPVLTVAAAIGLVVVQVGATYFHVSHGEQNRIALNIVLLLLAMLVVFGRLAAAPTV